MLVRTGAQHTTREQLRALLQYGHLKCRSEQQFCNCSYQRLGLFARNFKHTVHVFAVLHRIGRKGIAHIHVRDGLLASDYSWGNSAATVVVNCSSTDGTEWATLQQT